MPVLMVPPEGERWPTLGPQVCDFITKNLIFGPGDLRGLPAILDPEKQALIWHMYEVYPQGHQFEGRRRFKRVGLSLAKGLAKTELAAWIAACELHPDAPVRSNGFDADGKLKQGKGVRSPFVPLVAFTEEQSEELCYGTLYVVLSEGPLASDFEIGLERIARRRGDGEAVPLAGAPSARDGSRTTFQVADETHWWTLPRLKQAHQTMMANLAKRLIADPWALEVTTAPEPGAGSVAEDAMDYARAVQEDRASDSRFFFYHREAGDEHDISTEEGARAAVIEASGAAAAWRDIEFIVELWRDPTTDRQYWERVWCNRLVKASAKAFDPLRWGQLAKGGDYTIPDGALVTLGFDGALFFDSTGLVATEVATGFQQVVGAWERPYGTVGDEWQVPEEDVDDVMGGAFQRWDVWRLYADPPWWQSWVAKWAGQHGAERVIAWHTNRRTPMTRALESFQTAIQTGALSHDGHPVFARHIANAFRHDLAERDDQGAPLFLIRKERPDSPNKIDVAMAGILSWVAAQDAIASNAKGERRPSVYQTRDLRVIGSGPREDQEGEDV